MRAVVQRVSRARVTVNGWTSGEIGSGLVALVAWDVPIRPM
jgi:D-Tyr-tRNAtyr deacylase